MAKRKKSTKAGIQKAAEAPGGPFDHIQHPKKRAFLTAYCYLGNIRKTAETVEIDRTTPFAWVHADPVFATAFDEARRLSSIVLEEEARRRAVEGVHRLKFHEGKVIQIEVDDPDKAGQKKWIPYVEHEYSDTLLIFLMKGNNPEKYRERTEVKHEGKIDTTTTHIIPAPVIGKLLPAPPQPKG